MNALTKSLLGAGAAALATLTAAAPAQAQYYPYPDQRQGVDLGAIARGVATAGAVAAVVGAITNAARGGTYGNRGVYGNGTYGNGGYGVYGNGTYGNGTYGNGTYGYPSQSRGYGYGSQNFERAAVDACGAQAQRYGRVSIDDVELRSRSTVRVRGMIEANAGYGGYGSYGGGIERRTFDCSFRSDGRITDFDTGRVRY